MASYLMLHFMFCTFKKKNALLIDEYSVPLNKVYHHDYYGQMIDLIRAMLHAVRNMRIDSAATRHSHLLGQ